MLTSGEIDQLALEGLNVTRAARKAGSFDYDITGYRRVPRLDTPFGQFQTWDYEFNPASAPGPHPECRTGHSFLFRLAGFDGGELESLSIARKFGLRHGLELAPSDGLTPLTREQLSSFEERWTKQVLQARETYRALGAAAGINLIDDPEQIWVVTPALDSQPLDVFLDQYATNPQAVEDDFADEYGFALPLGSAPATPRETARRIAFWEYLRKRYSQIVAIQTSICRKHLNGRMVSNIEFDMQVDYPSWGDAFDMPGLNMRSALFGDEAGYQYWVAYGTRLAADLTHRTPMMSVRSNLVAAGARIIPTRQASRYWYSRAVQNGAAGFFLWIRDYPGDRNDPNGYAGPCMDNPDPSTLPLERWETHLEVTRALSGVSTFEPPCAETGVLVSIPSCASGKWTSVFSTYVETARAGIFARFVSSAELRVDSRWLEGLRLLFIPSAPFEHRAVVERLAQAVREGLWLVVADEESFLFDEAGEPNEPGQRLLGFARRSAAVSERRLGAGRVIVARAPSPERLRHWRVASGAADHSWVFDVTIDNLSDVTGPANAAQYDGGTTDAPQHG